MISHSALWSATANLATARELHTATLLPNGKVLAAAGGLSSAELYDVGLGFLPSWQPLLTTVSPSVMPGGSSLTASGSRFKGISEASGGSVLNSSSNYPLVQLLSLSNGQTLFLPPDMIAGWSDTSFTSTPLTVMTTSSSGFPIGHALVTLFTNGIPSQSQTIRVPKALVAQSAVSRKTHGAAGPFDIALPLTGPPGIECRTAGGTSDHTVVVTFANSVTVAGNPQAQVISGTGCVGNGGTCTGSVSVSGATVTVPLTNIGNAQTINLKLFAVSSGEESGDITLAMSILAGDTNADGAINSGDTLQTRNRSGQATDATNFPSDVNLDGFVNSGDTLFVRTRAGTSLP